MIPTAVEGLSPGEIEALRAVTRAAHAHVPAGGRRDRVRTYDFRVPDKFSKEQMRALVHLHDSMSRSLTTSLSAHLRTTVQVEVPTVEQVTYNQFISQLPEPTIMAVAALPPLEGSAVVQLDTELAFPLIDRLLGGPGAGIAAGRALTEIEAIIIRRILNVLLDAWAETWRNVVSFKSRLSIIESNPLFVQVAAANESVLLISLEGQMGRQRGMFRICVSYATLEPLLAPLVSRQWFQHLPQRDRPEERTGLLRQLGSVSVPVSARLGRVNLRLQELIDLEPGDMVPLGAGAGETVTVYVGDRPKFTGRPGRVGSRLGVQIRGTVSH